MTKLFSLRALGFFITLLLSNVSALPAWSQNTVQATAKKPSHIVFMENSFFMALKQAKAQNKYVFVDAYATWCGPCKLLKERTFNNSEAADFYNANFINVSIDMERGEGPMLAAQWGVEAYPTLFIFNPKGQPVLENVGFLDVSDLLKFARLALSKAPSK